MGSNKRTTDFLKECMSDALISLMGKKEFSKITVNDIADTAGVNRSTWFRNFNSKNQALSFKMIRLWDRIIYTSHLQSVLYDSFYQVMMPQFGADAEECYHARFYSYGLFGLLDEWIKRDFHETPQEMAQLIHNITADT